ncbi:MAG: hypothetical protein KKF22_10115 [Gammaproteobacteria bacterium]|nr:hypothetical protein [Gammaproteobacteria bacterium]
MTISSGIQNFSQTTYRQFSNALSGQTQATEEALLGAFEAQTTETKNTAVTSADSQPQNFPELFSRSGEPLTPLSVQLKAIHVSELPEERYQEFMQAQKQLIEANQQYLEHQYSSRNNPLAESLPQTQPYATIKVGGKVIASVDNQGVVTTASGLNKDLLSMLPDDVNGSSGPNLAQARAEVLAGYLGGKVEKADTAITQLEFDLLQDAADMPASIDYAAMQNDPMFEHLQNLVTNLKNYESQRQVFLAGTTKSAAVAV